VKSTKKQEQFFFSSRREAFQQSSLKFKFVAEVSAPTDFVQSAFAHFP
jgi:hypothetical protein